MNQRDSELSHGQTGSDTAASPRSTSGLSNSVSSTASELKDSAREIKDQAVDKARSMFSGQKDQAVGELSAVAQALHRTGSDLQSEHPTVGKFTHQTASKIESFVRTIEDKEPEQILSDVKRMARNNPAVFIGGAVALGFIAARFLKTSGPDDDFYGDPTLARPIPAYEDTATGIPEGWRTRKDMDTPSATERAGTTAPPRTTEQTSRPELLLAAERTLPRTAESARAARDPRVPTLPPAPDGGNRNEHTPFGAISRRAVL